MKNRVNRFVKLFIMILISIRIVFIFMIIVNGQGQGQGQQGVTVEVDTEMYYMFLFICLWCLYKYPNFIWLDVIMILIWIPLGVNYLSEVPEFDHEFFMFLAGFILILFMAIMNIIDNQYKRKKRSIESK